MAEHLPDEDDIWYPVKRRKIMNKYVIEFYKDNDGTFRWRMRAKNGRIVADSSEGYNELRDAERGLRVVCKIVLEMITGYLEDDTLLENDYITVAYPCRIHDSDDDCAAHSREGCHS